ncbi:hypothetical protein C5167_001565 [Papaver somniferum]|uniref:non-specific serine/threonine protein kinase n=1 Tax=Papaver somniferum TaxID=3469 RepID=A0A4Y7KVJ3_PAPSO|nr:hypothetical protein C5167_001565 [Papaver somniferum]
MGNCCRRPPARCAHVSSPDSQNSHPLKEIFSIQEASSPQSGKTSLTTIKSNESASGGLKSYIFNDLRNVTGNFKASNLIGEGGFGQVFKGWIDENTLATSRQGVGMVVAIKKLDPESFQGYKEWLAEVNYLGHLNHENLVKLVGYCSESKNRLLVYEYMPRGSLENHLFRKSVQPIPWDTRMNIAISIARGLSFLHSLKTQVIYRDLKSSNILLDSNFNAKLSDFGFARDGPIGDKTHVSTRVLGTGGYAAPEYIATGHLSTKSDVYSFGVVLLELLSGRRALNERVGESNLVDWSRPFISDKKRVLRIMDTRLCGQYSKKEAQTAADLAVNCLNLDARNRPSMTEVFTTLEQFHTPNDYLRTPSREPGRSWSKSPPSFNYKTTPNTNTI